MREPAKIRKSENLSVTMLYPGGPDEDINGNRYDAYQTSVRVRRNRTQEETEQQFNRIFDAYNRSGRSNDMGLWDMYARTREAMRQNNRWFDNNNEWLNQKVSRARVRR